MAKNKDGVEIPDGGQVVGTQNEERLAFMQRINDQLDAGERGKELNAVNDDDTVSEFSPEDLDTPVVAKEEQQEEETDYSTPDITGAIDQEAVVAAPIEPPTKYKIKVNGTEKEVTLDELIATAQKIDSADEYLRRAKEAVQQPEIKAPPAPSKEDVRAAQVAEAKRIAQAIQMGNEEEAVQAVLALRNTGPSPDDLIRTVDERLTFQQAIARFRNEYKDVAEDPLLNKLAMERDNELIKQGDTRPYWERYDDIGKQIRGWVTTVASRANTNAKAPTAAPTPTAATTPTPIPIRAAKQALKAAAEQPPRSAAGKMAPPEEEPEKSPSQIIEEMRQARGGPQWLTGARGVN
jgi:hypothetical protein